MVWAKFRNKYGRLGLMAFSSHVPWLQWKWRHYLMWCVMPYRKMWKTILFKTSRDLNGIRVSTPPSRWLSAVAVSREATALSCNATKKTLRGQTMKMPQHCSWAQTPAPFLRLALCWDGALWKTAHPGTPKWVPATHQRSLDFTLAQHWLPAACTE